MTRRSLPVFQTQLDRRGVLTLGVAVGVCACAGDPAPIAEDAAASGDAAASVDGAVSADARVGGDAAESLDAGGFSDAEVSPDAESPLDAGTPWDAGPVMGPPGYVIIGPISDFPINRWSNRGAAGNAYIVGRDAAGLFIYSAVCTHSACLVPAPRGPGLRSTCPCHLSVFDDQGARISGLARSSLTHRAAAIVDDVVFVHPTMTVPATTRTPVP